MSVDATSGGVNANSYVTLAQASGYHVDEIYGSAWVAYSSTQKELAVKSATRMLDDYIEWGGFKATDTQALRWPRYGLDDRDGYYFEVDEIPPFLVNATSEFAKYLLDNQTTDITASEDTKGFKVLEVDTLKLEVDKDDRDSGSVIPESVVVMVEPYGVVKNKGGTGSVGIVRV